MASCSVTILQQAPGLGSQDITPVITGGAGSRRSAAPGIEILRSPLSLMDIGKPEVSGISSEANIAIVQPPIRLTIQVNQGRLISSRRVMSFCKPEGC